MPGQRPRRSRNGVRPFKWLGRGIGSTAKGIWRVVTVRRRRRNGAPIASISASLMDSGCMSQSEDVSEWSSCRQEEASLPFPALLNLQLPSWLSAMLSSDDSSTAAAAAAADRAGLPAIHASSYGNPVSQFTSSSSSNGTAALQGDSRVLSTWRQRTAGAPPPAGAAQGSSSSSSVQLLGEMLNLNSTFPMLLHTVGDSSSSAQDTIGASSSSSSGSYDSPISSRPQQLLTVGCRNWGNNWWDGKGLLRVKIYDFAIYVDGEEAKRSVPALTSSSSKQPGLDPNKQPEQQQQQLQQQTSSSTSSGAVEVEELPDLLKSRDSGVGMSLILRAARDVPLHLLSEEYEKVLQRRLARAGGDQSDTIALQQLLATFSSTDRLPVAVRGGGKSSSGGSMAAAEDGGLGAGSSSSSSEGGSVAKGAMLVFERSREGSVTARIGPHILGSVHSPRVAEALFDLYLGDQPVSKPAKDAAAQTLNRILSSSSGGSSAELLRLREEGAGEQGSGFGGANSSSSSSSSCCSGGGFVQQPYYLPQGKNEQIKCEGVAVQGVGRKAAKGGNGLGLSLSDLAACVLHMG